MRTRKTPKTDTFYAMNKFDQLWDILHNELDILMISETEIDDTLPEPQLYGKRYSKPFRLDRNSNGGGTILYAREDITC